MRLSWVGLASIILAVVIFASMFTAYREFYVKPLLEKYPPALRPIIDYEPFFSTWYGIITISVWILLAIFWTIIASKYWKRQNKYVKFKFYK